MHEHASAPAAPDPAPDGGGIPGDPPPTSDPPAASGLETLPPGGDDDPGGALPGNPDEWQPEEAARFLTTLLAVARQLNFDRAAIIGAPGEQQAAPPDEQPPAAPAEPAPAPLPTGSGRHPAIDPERLSPELKIRIGIREQGLGIRRRT